VEAALYAGCRFFAAYPITPATEIGEKMSLRMPQVGGMFIQMEDELGSICSVIGASLAGKKAMTATASTGYNLMLEALSYAVTCEVPLVVTNVQRTRGYIHASQADVMQSRWGTSGDHQMIVFAPSSVQEYFDLQIEAFNYAEYYRNPVVLLLDETIAHMREKLVIPEPDQIKRVNRKKPSVPPENYLPFAADETDIPEMSRFGDGYNVLYSINPHDERGYNVWRSETFNQQTRRVSRKITRDADAIFKYDSYYLEDSEVIVIAYGITARSALEAVRQARQAGMKAGLIKLKTLWPCAEKSIRALTEKAKRIFVAEMNLGQYVREIERITHKDVISITKTNGAVFSSGEILEEMKRNR
ncbi:MAG: 2-oxoacid:acceptor oxidoreductase subunit alpha, partial [Deltaproteobacteria bacterium]|nr:2-oxoacid:acceptor oxidoreductase subunit alpha [Deltaproteobacteria bacterium]